MVVGFRRQTKVPHIRESHYAELVIKCEEFGSGLGKRLRERRIVIVDLSLRFETGRDIP
jgi:hypothetical protein